MAFVAAVPAVASAAGTAAGGTAAAAGAGGAAGAAGGAAGGAAAGGGGTAAAAGAGGRAAAAGRGGGAAKGGGGGKAGDLLSAAGGGGKKKESPGKGDKAKSWGKKSLAGSKGKYRRILVAEFLTCVLLLAFSPLAKKDGEMTAGRFMKRGSATCAMFILLGLMSAFGPGAGKAAAYFGGLCTLVLLVDQREAAGKLAKLLNAPDVPDAPVGPPDGVPESGNVGPDTPWDPMGPGLVQT